MADCNDINKSLSQMEEELRLVREMKAKLKSASDLSKAKPDANTKTLKTYTGDEISIDTSEWAARAELEAIEMGEAAIVDMVTDGFQTKRRPTGETGRMTSYRKLPPTEVELAKLLEVMGLKRSATGKGIALMRPFTEQAASKALMKMASETGANPRDIAQSLGKRFKNIDNLPAGVYAVAKARWETSTEFAEVLEEMADAIDESRLTDEMRVELGNSARWAHYFEQLDAAVRRKVGQALRTMQFNPDQDPLDFIDLKKDVTELTFEDIAEGSLLAQALEHVDNGDAMKLRRIAKAKRVIALTRSDINRPNFLVELEVLNQYRKNNLFSSISSWGIRNLSSGWVAAHLTLEDVVGGALRVGPLNEWHAASYGAKKLVQGFGMVFQNAADSLFDGKSRMAVNSLRDIDPVVLRENQDFVESTLSNSLANLTKNPLTPDQGFGAAQALSVINIWNAAVANLLGKLVSKLPGRFKGSTAGYMASFRLLNGGDEALRTIAWLWKTSHESYLRAIEESTGVISEKTGKSLLMSEIEEIAEAKFNRATFKGVMTDDDLARFRKERNATLGMPPGKEIDNDELRLQMFNNLNGVPNVGDEIADIGVKRMEEITFTGKLPKALAGVQLLRSNPIGGYLLPVFRSAYHGVEYIMSRNFLGAVFNQVMVATKKASGGAVTRQQEIDAWSRTIVSGMITLALWNAWKEGVWKDGGPNLEDDAANQAYRRVHGKYALSVGFGDKLTAKVQLGSIDFFDMLGLTSDLFRALDEGALTESDWEYSMTQIGSSMANVLDEKSGLEGAVSFLQALFNPQRYDMNWALQRNLSGIAPMSGFAGNISRASKEPGAYPDKRRDMTLEEAKMMGKSQTAQRLQGIASFLGDGVLGNYPYYDELTDRPYKRDWTGGAKDIPFGLPADHTIPYMFLMESQSPVPRYLAKHGFEGKPRPDGSVSIGMFVPKDDKTDVANKSMKMSNKEEALYRDRFLTEVGDVKAEFFGLTPDINKYVAGKNFNDAMIAVIDDDAYNALLASPPESPSRTVNPRLTLAERKTLSSDHAIAYQPIQHIIDYYDRLGLIAMYKESPTFSKRHAAYLKKFADDEQERRTAREDRLRTQRR